MGKSTSRRANSRQARGRLSSARAGVSNAGSSAPEALQEVEESNAGIPVGILLTITQA